MNFKPFAWLALTLATLTSGLQANPSAGKTQHLTAPDQVPQGLAKSDWASIRAAYEAGRHAFMPIEGGWQARNPGQQWTTKFDGRGFVSAPKGGGWQWGLELQSYGFPGALRPIKGVSAVQAEGQRLTYGWDAALTEWFVNDQRGLEHGYTVQSRPPGAANAPLEFQLAVRGTLLPRVSADAQGLEFCDTNGATVINYSGLKVWDADGKILPSHFAPLDTRHPSLTTLLVDERGARYPLTIDPVAQQAYLKASQVTASDSFGWSVAASGNTVVVGAPNEDSSTTGVNSTADEGASGAGAAYVFVRSGTIWSQQAYLKPAVVGTTQAGDDFGWSVAVNGDTVVIGADREDSSTTGINSTPNESAGDSGAAYVFVRSGTTWSQQAYLKASQVTANDQFGISVAVAGDTVVVGASAEDSSTTGVNSTSNESAANSGAAYVFVRSGVTWSQEAYLKASQVTASDNFGWSVAVSGDTVVVGAIFEDSSTTGINGTPNESAANSGAAYVFVRSGSTWSQEAYLKAGQVTVNDNFGYSVAASGDTVVVGARSEDSSTTGVNSTPDESAADSGAAYVFVRSGTTWSQQAYLKAGNAGAGDSFGVSVSLSADTLAVGANLEDSSTGGVNSTPNEFASGAGAAYVFVRSGTTWSQQAYLKASNTGASDSFGYAVAVAGDTVVVGSPFEDSSTTGVNSSPNESAADSGAAYIFLLTPEIAVEQPVGTDLVDGFATVNFGSVPVGATSSLVFTIKNTSANAALTGLGITINGTSAAQFTVTASPTSPVSGPSGRTTFTVQFAPTSLGSKTAALHIANNDANENPFDINLTGTSTNTLPIAGVDNLIRAANTSMKIAITNLLANDSDADGDAFTLTAVSASTNGVTVLTNATTVFYANANNVNDQFTYTITDARGGSATGTVNITMASVTGSNSIVSLQPGFAGTGADYWVRSIVAQSNGKVTFGGDFSTVNGTSRNYVARMNADGTLDSNFASVSGGFGSGSVNCVAVLPDGKVIIGGVFQTVNGTSRNRIARLNTDGSLDSGFNPGTGANDSVLAVAVQPDGKAIVGGSFTAINGTNRNGIVRMNADANLDSSFNIGTGISGYSVASITLQTNGTIVVGGTFNAINGTSRTNVARLNADGSVDTSFNPGTGPNNGVSAMATQADGKVIIVGGFTSVNGTNRNRIARLNADGSLDIGFNPGTGADGGVNSVAVQTDGKVIIGGSFFTVNGVSHFSIARLNADGSLDGSFNPGLPANSLILAVTPQTDGKIFIGGNFTTINGVARTYIARLNADGSLDTSFLRGPSAAALTFAGIPGYQYIAQFATNLSTSPWFDLSTNTVGTNGLWQVIDPTATNAQRYYRVRTP